MVTSSHHILWLQWMVSCKNAKIVAIMLLA